MFFSEDDEELREVVKRCVSAETQELPAQQKSVAECRNRGYRAAQNKNHR